jgi:hypothetical protein
MVLVYAAHGESQDKMQSVRNALDTSGCRFKCREDHHPMINSNSLLSKRTKLNAVLVQFAYDVNYFFPANIEMLVLHQTFIFATQVL